jgi:hypothetical protein
MSSDDRQLRAESLTFSGVRLLHAASGPRQYVEANIFPTIDPMGDRDGTDRHAENEQDEAGDPDRHVPVLDARHLA